MNIEIEGKNIYIELCDDKISTTREIVRDTLLFDYDEDGRVIGVEVILPEDPPATDGEINAKLKRMRTFSERTVAADVSLSEELIGSLDGPADDTAPA